MLGLMPRRVMFLSDAEQLAKALAKTIRYSGRKVEFDDRTLQGRARLGDLGLVEFEESGNDIAVNVTVTVHFKTSAEQAMRILERMRQVIREET